MKTTTLTALAAACLLSACQKEAGDATTTTAPAATAPAAELTAVLDATAGGDPQAIHVIRHTAKPGDEITIHGRIMGNSSPFVDGRAVFILGDTETLVPCNEIPGDECETPWDVCCESKEDKKLGTATVQIVDAGGRVLKQGVEGTGGLEKLAKVTVTGTVAEGSSADLLLVNATAIDTAK